MKKSDAKPKFDRYAHLGPSGLARRIKPKEPEDAPKGPTQQPQANPSHDTKKAKSVVARTAAGRGKLVTPEAIEATKVSGPKPNPDRLGDVKRRRGRPNAAKPWEAEGISRMTWYRRQKEPK